MRVTGLATTPYLAGTSFYYPPGATAGPRTAYRTFAHEGRMPPLTADNRPDYKYPVVSGVNRNVGDDATGLLRLRRVWDSWSTEYGNASPDSWTDQNPAFLPTYQHTFGPAFGDPPIYPSYPPPYEKPINGLQIQVRVVDPRNERIKVLTIRQDFR